MNGQYKVLCAGLLAWSFAASAGSIEVRVGKIYPFKGAVQDKPLFVQTTKVETVAPGDIRTEAVTRDDQGEVVMRESAKILNGMVVEQRTDQLQIGERYKLMVKDGKVQFKTYALNGDEEKLKEESSEDLKKDFVMGPAMEPFLQSQADHLSKGEKVKANFGAFEAGRSVEFVFRPKTRAPAGDALQVRMEPASMWLNLMIDPIDLELEPGTYRLTHYHGRTPLKVKTKSGWKPLDADIQISAVKP